MTRVLLTGSTGRLGGAFLSLWGKDPRFSLHTITRADADLSRPQELQHLLQETDFDLLVNPAAISGLEECLDNPEQAEIVNVHSPHVMAQVCREKQARFIHFSTDYVFGGHEEGKKSETDTPAPINVYGNTKLAGEQAVLEANPNAIVARVSWLFGPSPPNRSSHFDQVLDQAIAGKPQQFIHDKFSMPTFTHDVVKWIEQLLQKDTSSGIYHLCNSGEPESWFSYAEKICQIAHRHIPGFLPPTLTGLSIADAHFFREQRPVHTAMNPDRLEKEGIVCPRHWLEAAEDYMEIR